MKAVFGTKKGADVLRVLLAAVLVMLLIASFFALAACNKKDGPDPAAERAEAVNALKINTLAALDAEWTPGLTDAEIIGLASPGSYIEATLWTEMLAEVVSASRLQTGKIRTAAEFIASDEGRKLFADAAGNLDSAMELVDALGLTSEDVSELGFDLLCAVVSETRAMYTEVANRLNAIKDKVLGAGNENIAAAAERAERIVESFGKDEASAAESVAQTIKALAEAEEGVKTVLAFAYDTERIFGTGESGAGLAGLIGSAAEGEGALANVSEREMFAWLDGVLAGFEEFGKSMTAEKIASVKAALASVRECFQGFAQPVEVVRDVMEWLRGAEELLGEVPFLTGAIAAATDVIYERGEDGGYTYDFVRRLKLLAEEEDGTLADINSYILAGEAILSFAKVYDAQAVKDELKQLAENGGEMTTLVIYAMALMFEASEQEGEDIEFTDDIAALAVALLTEVMGSATETAWNNYVSDPEKYENRLRVFSGLVLGFAEVLNENIAAHGGTRVDINVTSDGPYTAEWYAEVVRIRRETIERAGAFTEGDALSSVAVGIIGEYVDKCYASLPDIERAVSAGWVEDAESEEAKLVTEMAANNPIFMLLAMFM